MNIKKFVVFTDGSEYELAPITYKEFSDSDFWYGADDLAWEAFKRVNGWSEINKFNDETLEGHKIILKYRDKPLDIDSYNLEVHDTMEEFYNHVFRKIDISQKDIFP